ncbi:MAG: glucoamylase family protein [Candidatus Omnitrophota bacterium]
MGLLLFFSFASFAQGLSEEEKFLDKLERDSFRYFIKEVNPENGLIKDSSRLGAPCSVAVVGFGLTALCIGESRGWISHEKAYERVLQILRAFMYNVPHERGFFYHFLDMRTGKRAWNSEASSIDTALFLAGALFAGEYFRDTEIERIARALYERVDWPWMMNGKKAMCMGWKPETGFLWHCWDSYSEAMILYALAIGSPTHPIAKDAWFEWKRPRSTYKEYEVIYSYFGSIFTYQYSHAWIDFRRLRDRKGNIDYYANSVNATLANRQFCIDNAAEYETYGENSWGLTACIGPEGYKGYGAKPGLALSDGTIAPCGIAGSLVFAKEESVKGLKYLYDRHKRFLYGKYGFKDAFNANKDWWAEEYLGIDVGITLIMIENYRTGMVWKAFMGIGPVKAWTEKCFNVVKGPSAVRNAPTRRISNTASGSNFLRKFGGKNV